MCMASCEQNKVVFSAKALTLEITTREWLAETGTNIRLTADENVIMNVLTMVQRE